MAALLLIDGYNIAQPIAPARRPDPRWLQRTRESLLRDLTEHLPPEVRQRTCVVFDAADPPRDRPSEYSHEGIEVRFAVEQVTADELLEELIRAHHTPKRLMVVSSDHRVQISARRRSARHFDSQPWMDDLTDGKIHLAVPIESLGGDTDAVGGAGQGGGSPSGGDSPAAPRRSGKPRIEDPEEVEQWMREFGFDEE